MNIPSPEILIRSVHEHLSAGEVDVGAAPPATTVVGNL
jgi:hypothetical protein